MSRFTVGQARAAAERAGFTPAESAVMAAIAMAESGGNSEAVGPVNRNGTRDYGAWQINSVHASALASGDWRKLDDNARMARQVWTSQGFKAWTVFNTGAYRQHLSAATSAATSVAPTSTATGLAELTPQGVSNPIEAVSALASLPATIDRWGSTFGIILGAAFLVAVGLALIFRREAADVAKTAVKVVA